jgi:hypothetical protein
MTTMAATAVPSNRQILMIAALAAKAAPRFVAVGTDLARPERDQKQGLNRPTDRLPDRRNCAIAVVVRDRADPGQACTKRSPGMRTC